jgi:hypothetical protein
MTIVTSLLSAEKAAGSAPFPNPFSVHLQFVIEACFHLHFTRRAAANAASAGPASRSKKKQREQRLLREACSIVKVC